MNNILEEPSAVDKSEVNSVSNTLAEPSAILIKEPVESDHSVSASNQVAPTQSNGNSNGVLEIVNEAPKDIDRDYSISSDSVKENLYVENVNQFNSSDVPCTDQTRDLSEHMDGEVQGDAEIMQVTNEGNSSGSEDEDVPEGTTVMTVDNVQVIFDPPCLAEVDQEKDAFSRPQSVIDSSDLGSDDEASSIFSESSESSDEEDEDRGDETKEEPTVRQEASKTGEEIDKKGGSKKGGKSKKKEDGMKVRGELDLEDLPPIEELSVTVPEEECQPLGRVYSIVNQLVVVESLPQTPALDLESVLFRAKGSPLGAVFDVFGPVKLPYYSVRFNTHDDILRQKIEVGETVYCAPQTNYTKYIFVFQLMQQRGSDASWQHNHEPPPSKLDYSDDEDEKKAKHRLLQLERKVNEDEEGGPEQKQMKVERLTSARGKREIRLASMSNVRGGTNRRGERTPIKSRFHFDNPFDKQAAERRAKFSPRPGFTLKDFNWSARFSPQGSMFGPQTSGYSPQSNGFSPHSSVLSPQHSGLKQSHGFSPQSSRYSPQSSGFNQTCGYSGQTPRFSPQNSGFSTPTSFSSQPCIVNPQSSGFIARGARMTFGSNGANSELRRPDHGLSGPHPNPQSFTERFTANPFDNFDSRLGAQGGGSTVGAGQEWGRPAPTTGPSLPSRVFSSLSAAQSFGQAPAFPPPPSAPPPYRFQ